VGAKIKDLPRYSKRHVRSMVKNLKQMNKQNKRGSYRKPEEKRKNKITILLTGDELAKIESARKEKGQCRSSFIRDSLIPNSSLMDFFIRNVGKAVVIDWVHPEDNWFYFRILEVKNKDEILIKGMNTPRGSKHKGDEFLISISDVRSVGLRQ